MLPTSVLFDGEMYGVKSKWTAPLISYNRRLQNGSSIYLDKSFGTTNKKWGEAKDQLYELVIERTSQYTERIQTNPLKHYDKELERLTIERYAKTDGETDPPLVSIVMPAWNRQELVEPAIKSVQAQIYQNWELLIVDDGSTDDTAKVVERLMAHDDRIRLFSPGHGGVCKARNHGIENARGSLVAFLDSDNTWTKEFLQVSIAMLLEAPLKASYSIIEMEDDNSRKLYRTTTPNASLLEGGNFIDLNALIVEKKLLDKVGYFDESLRRMVDYDLVCRISKHTEFLYVPIIGVNYVNHENLSRISTTESTNWDGVVKNKNFLDWSDKKQRDGDKTSIVVPVRGTILPSLRSIRSILQTTKSINKEIVISDASATSAMNIAMGSLSIFDSSVKYYRESACRDTVLVSNYGFMRTSGSTVVFVGQNTVVESGWLDPLTNKLTQKEIRAPLQLWPNRTIRSAGVGYINHNTPVNFLMDHPLSDSDSMEEVYDVRGFEAGCFATTASLFASLHGLNPLYGDGFESYDFGLRALVKEKAKLQLARTSVILNPVVYNNTQTEYQDLFSKDWPDVEDKKSLELLWNQAGFEVEKYVNDNTGDGTRDALTPLLKAKKKPAQYRWAIKISAPSNERRFAWGDLYYAQSLAASLQKLGQKVAIDFHDYHERRTSYLDDINLDLRGLDNFKPQKGKVNVLWVISHPDKVVPEMVRNFDKVYAAGDEWAKYMSEKAGVDIDFLPQCTDINVFRPPAKVNKEFADKVLFVGNSRNVLRPIVKDAIDAKLDLAVYGGGWEGLIDQKYIRGTFIPNDKLAVAYGSAKVVLNDHWDDMRRWGFISNRLFDAVASGAKVISDDVPGIEGVFDQQDVRVYSTPAELRSIVESTKKSGKRKQSSASTIKKNHSFDARAQTLLASIKELKGQS